MLESEARKFIEGETNIVDIRTCCKAVMKTVVDFLFIGDVELHDLSLPDLVNMMNMTSMMMLEDVHEDVEDYVLENIPNSGENYAALPELVNSLMLAENFNFEMVKEVLVLEIYINLKDIPDIPDVVQDSEAFKMLPANLLKAILFKDPFDEDEEEHEADDGGNDLGLDQTLDQFLSSTTYVEEDDEDYPSEEDTDDDLVDYDNGYYEYINGLVTEYDRLKAFVFWLSGNECSDEDKKEIKDSIDLMHSCFTARKLLTEVRQSGLFSIKEVDDRVLEVIKDKELE